MWIQEGIQRGQDLTLTRAAVHDLGDKGDMLLTRQCVHLYG